MQKLGKKFPYYLQKYACIFKRQNFVGTMIFS